MEKPDFRQVYLQSPFFPRVEACSLVKNWSPWPAHKVLEPAVAKKASGAAEGLCKFVGAMVQYHGAAKIVKPTSFYIRGIVTLEVDVHDDGSEIDSIEFRINGEDAGRGFLPAPGPVSMFEPPTGPGVRLDSGVETGSVIGGSWNWPPKGSLVKVTLVRRTAWQWLGSTSAGRPL